jgi:hypothetical protein
MDIIEFRRKVEAHLKKAGIDGDKFPGLVGGIAQDAITFAGDFATVVFAEARETLKR